MTMTWAKVDNATGVVLNVECATREWVEEHTSANSGAHYTYIPTDPESLDYAGIGYTWDESLKRFIPPAPYPSWTYDSATYGWAAPMPYPTDGAGYTWDDESGSWTAIPAPVKEDNDA